MTPPTEAPGDTGRRGERPTADVLRAFGAAAVPELLAGGRGLTWRAGNVVLRPAGEEDEATWKSETLSVLAESDDFTVPRPLRTAEGAWVRDGWEALEWIPGDADPARVDDVVRAGLAFQRAIAVTTPPAFISASTDLWSRADRMAWEEDRLPRHELLRQVAEEFRPVEARSRIIHGDLLGNVLFSAGRHPAIIDWAPYWRPPGLGAAIAVADAACWHGYDLVGLADDHGIAEWRQLLLRALAFRMATQHLHERWDDDFTDRHAPVVAAVVALHES
ncbi:TIGR02569 family protein [Frondihabitans sucicola]|uniref:TIGR02569 family protein n=1 Tax=Frondihabitans sucicola TaxID=1268041 RepID=A0ABM8GSV0_9MICO|nr:hypothetical protein [Frondihabitans sucicola]BDZ51545.1 TIGR02569 family protein [Frondihabitans sucicola]